jgi:hypothetical protein
VVSSSLSNRPRPRPRRRPRPRFLPLQQSTGSILLFRSVSPRRPVCLKILPRSRTRTTTTTRTSRWFPCLSPIVLVVVLVIDSSPSTEHGLHPPFPLPLSSKTRIPKKSATEDDHDHDDEQVIPSSLFNRPRRPRFLRLQQSTGSISVSAPSLLEDPYA